MIPRNKSARNQKLQNKIIVARYWINKAKNSLAEKRSSNKTMIAK